MPRWSVRWRTRHPGFVRNRTDAMAMNFVSLDEPAK
jgi:hypothetical protein